MKHLSFLVIGLAILLAGCGQAPAPTPGRAALIDLEEAAKRLGRDAVITQELKDAGGALGADLAEAQKEYQGELERYKQAIGAKPTQTDTEKLAELSRTLNMQFQQKQQQAQQELVSKRVALVNRFREEIKPIAMKIAASKGLDMVLVKSDIVVLGNASELDITDAVVAEMTKIAQPAASPASSPSPSGN